MIDFKIVKPEGVVYEDTIDKVTLPTAAGEITVLPLHAPLISTMGVGELTIYKGDVKLPMSVAGGILEIRPDSKVYVMADAAERAEEIDIERAEVARKRAEEAIKNHKNIQDVDFARLQARIEREVNRIGVGKKYRKIK